MICMEFQNFFNLFSFKLTKESLKYIRYVQSDSNNVSTKLIFIFSQFYAKVPDQRAVGLSIRTPPPFQKRFYDPGIKLFPTNSNRLLNIRRFNYKKDGDKLVLRAFQLKYRTLICKKFSN